MVVAVVLVAVLTVNVGNLRVGGSIGYGVDGGVMNLRIGGGVGC